MTDNLAHAPYPHRRSVLEEIERRFPDEVAATARSPFRSDTDLSMLSSFAQHYGLLTGTAYVAQHPDQSERAYINISNSDLEWQLKKVLERQQDFLCLADHHDHALNQERLDQTLTDVHGRLLPGAGALGDRRAIAADGPFRSPARRRTLVAMTTRPALRISVVALACISVVATGSTARSVSSVVLGSAVSTYPCGGSGGTVTALPQTLGPSAPAYVATFDGVVTSMSYSAGTVLVGTQVRAAFVRPVGANTYTVQEKGPLFPMVAGTVTAYPMRLSVHANDYLALNITGPGADDLLPCAYPNTGSSFVISASNLDSTSTLTPSLIDNAGLPDISVVLEPDADQDGYGDVSQDQCPTSALDHGPCVDRVAPDTTVTKKPSKKTTKHKAVIVFASSDPTATFECALDSKTRFKACTSPWKRRVDSGRHKVLVRAVDAAGNLDATPATVKWRVQPRRPAAHG